MSEPEGAEDAERHLQRIRNKLRDTKPPPMTGQIFDADEVQQFQNEAAAANAAEEEAKACAPDPDVIPPPPPLKKWKPPADGSKPPLPKGAPGGTFPSPRKR